eukprot:1856674-Amphidinium_carterae.1
MKLSSSWKQSQACDGPSSVVTAGLEIGIDRESVTLGSNFALQQGDCGMLIVETVYPPCATA